MTKEEMKTAAEAIAASAVLLFAMTALPYLVFSL